MSSEEASDNEGGLQREVVAVAVATYDFTARKETELSFKKGDVVNIFLMNGNWWVGTLASDKHGEGRKFPNNYVSVDKETMRKEKAVTQTAFEARTASELSVPAGETVVVIDFDQKKPWATAEYKGRRGQFPSAFLQITAEASETPASPRIVISSGNSGTLTVTPPPGSSGAPSPLIDASMKPPPSPPTEADARMVRMSQVSNNSGPVLLAPPTMSPPPGRHRSHSNAVKKVEMPGTPGSPGSPDKASNRIKLPALKVGSIAETSSAGALTTTRKPLTPGTAHEGDHQRSYSALNTYRRSNRYSMDPRLMEKPPELKLGDFEAPSETKPKISIPESSRTMVSRRNRRLSSNKDQLAMMAEAAGVMPLAEKGQYEAYPFDEPDDASTILLKRGTVHISGDNGHPEHDEECQILVAGTMPKILSYVTAPSSKYDVTVDAREQLIRVLAACFKIHMAPAELFIMLESRFLSARDAVVDAVTGSNAIEIQINVLKIIREWVKIAFEFDFKNDSLLLTTVKSFLKSVVNNEPKKIVGPNGSVTSDISAIRTSVKRTADQLLELFNLYETRPSVWENLQMGVVDGGNNPFMNSIAERDCDVATGATILCLEPKEFAEQLALMDFYLFEKITPSELVSGAWTKKNAEETCPRISAITRFFNQKSKWAEQAILTCEDHKAMRHMLKFFLGVAECLFEIGDYNGMMIYLSAVNSSAISRLKKLWKPKETKLAQKLGKLMASNFKELRQLQSRIIPCVPYVGMTLTDLVYIQDGNPDFYKNEKGEETKMYNWEKILLMGTSFQRLAHLQTTSFNFEPQGNIIRIIHSMRPTISEEDAYQLSLKIQPRGSSDKH